MTNAIARVTALKDANPSNTNVGTHFTTATTAKTDASSSYTSS